MTMEKIHFTKEKETMLMTLSGRAIQSQWEHPILRDPWAEEAMRHIDYDMSKTLKGVSSWGIWKKIGPTIIATRAATFDLLTTRYLADHPMRPCSTWAAAWTAVCSESIRRLLSSGSTWITRM